MMRRGSAYRIMLYLGCVSGIYLGARVAALRGMPPYTFAFSAVALVPAGLSGARWWHRTRTGNRGGNGGAAVYGGLVAVLAASAPLLALVHLRFLAFWDVAALSMIVGLCVTKIGCAINGCCAGRETSGPLGFVSRNARGELCRRYPAQWLEAAWAGGIAAVAASFAASTRSDGVLFGGIAAAYGLGRIVLEQIRENEPGSRLGWTNTAISVVLVLAGACLYALGSEAW